MLKFMSIHNYTVTEHVELELQDGMTVITGETGAGKSIMIDALALCLGARADSSAIRVGCEQMDITVNFEISKNSFVQGWLNDNELSSENECILRRVVKQDGRSLSMINGRSVPLQLTRQLAEFLVTIHGQHEQHTLFKRDTHRTIVDNYANHQHLLEAMQQHYYSWKKTQNEIEHLTTQVHDQTRVDFLSFQLQELNDLHLEDGELPSIEQEHRQLMHADTILEQCQSALDLIRESEEQNITKQLHQSLQLLEKLIPLNASIKATHELLNGALINCQEAATEIQQYLSKVDNNPQRLNELEQRLQNIYNIARKHRIKAQEIPQQRAQLEQELLQLTERDALLEKLRKTLSQQAETYFQAAQKLSASRQKAIKKLSKEITDSVRPLGMPQANFEIHAQPLENLIPQLNGMETLEFYVATNPGIPSQPLKKVVSGGELSRISLAIQVITAQNHATPTLLFDEVDVGIGGATAEIVGKLLRKLAEHHQVICVTHQAQVAAQGHQHLRVEKRVENNISASFVRQLALDEKIEEIARMIGGQNITARTRAHAKELVSLV